MPPREPTNLMRRTAAALFPESGEEQAAFLGSLLEPEDRGTALAWTGPRVDPGFPVVARGELPAWLPEFIDLAGPGEKPGKTDAYREGRYYPMDFSSVLTGSALLALAGPDLAIGSVLDLCAAPGGKSVLASRILEPTLLVANEVEGRRLGMLRHNLGRCRIPNPFTQRLHPTPSPGAMGRGRPGALRPLPRRRSLLGPVAPREGNRQPGMLPPRDREGKRPARAVSSASSTGRVKPPALATRSIRNCSPTR